MTLRRTNDDGDRRNIGCIGNEPFRICERERICFHALWVVQLAVCYFDWSTAVYVEGSGGSVYGKMSGLRELSLWQKSELFEFSEFIDRSLSSDFGN